MSLTAIYCNFYIFCAYMNVDTMVAVLINVYNHNPVALKKVNRVSVVYCYIHDKLAGSYCS